MKANRKNVILIAFLFTSLGLSGQTQGELRHFYQEYLKAKKEGPSYSEKIAGSPYGTAEFMDAMIYMSGSKSPVHGNMRYNNYMDEMEFRMNNDEQVLILEKKHALDSILLDNKTYQYLPYSKDTKEGLGFFVRLSNGECKLYKRSLKKFQDEKVPKSGYDDYVPPSFIDMDVEFYVDFGDGKLVYLPQRGKKMVELFLEKGFENKGMSKVKYNEGDLMEYVEGLKKVG